MATMENGVMLLEPWESHEIVPIGVPARRRYMETGLDGRLSGGIGSINPQTGRKVKSWGRRVSNPWITGSPTEDFYKYEGDEEEARLEAAKKEAMTDRFGYHSINPNLNKIEQFLQAEKQRNNQLPLAEYNGPTQANKSRLTQRAEDLRTQHFGGLGRVAPMPYQAEIQEFVQFFYWN